MYFQVYHTIVVGNIFLFGTHNYHVRQVVINPTGQMRKQIHCIADFYKVKHLVQIPSGVRADQTNSKQGIKNSTHLI